MFWNKQIFLLNLLDGSFTLNLQNGLVETFALIRKKFPDYCLLLCWLCGWLLLDNLLLLGASCLRFLCWQRLRTLNRLAVECSVLGGRFLQLLEGWCNHTILGTLDEAELEALEVGQV